MKILNIAYRQDNKPLITNLYLQLLSDKYNCKEDEKLMNKINPIMLKVWIIKLCSLKNCLMN